MSTLPESRRGIAFERIWRIAQTLRGLRYGLTFDALNSELIQQTGHTWHERTVRRDCSLLEYLGLIEVTAAGVVRWISPDDLFDVNPARVRAAADRASWEANQYHFREMTEA